MSALVFVEVADGALTSGSRDAVALALAATGEPVRAISASPLDAELADALSATGVGELFHPDAPVVDSARVAAAIVPLLDGGSVPLVSAPPSVLGREVIGRLAALTEAPLLTGVSSLHPDATAGRRALTVADGGRRLVTTAVTAGLLLATAHPGLAADRTTPPSGGRMRQHPLPLPPSVVREVTLLGSKPFARDDADDLGSARFVVGGGRGLGSAEGMQRLSAWARSVGAAFGSSRAPVEAGWVSYDRLIGQTGTEIHPEVYLAWGISGAPQHLAGMRASRTVIAVNADPAAPIAGESDVLLVADASELLAELAG